MVNNFDTVYEEAPVEDAIKKILNGQASPDSGE